MLNRIQNLAIKEFIQITRNWLLLIFIILGPVMELVLLARATSQGTTHMATVVVDQDHSQTSRQIIRAIDNTEELDVVAYLDSPDQADTWLERSQAVLTVVLPPNLEADLLAARSPETQLIADGTNSTSSGSALNAAVGAINAFGVRRAAAYFREWPTIDVRTQVRYNPTQDANHFTITAQLGFVIYQVALVVAVSGLTRERELGTLEQLLVTPTRRLELIIGKAIPALVIASMDFLLMYAIAVWGFQVPMRGPFVVLLTLSLFFIVAEIGLGLTVSAISRTQQQSALIIFVLAMIDVSFSGYVMPVERMPATLYALAQLFPLQHYLAVIRSVMLKGGRPGGDLASSVGARGFERRLHRRRCDQPARPTGLMTNDRFARRKTKSKERADHLRRQADAHVRQNRCAARTRSGHRAGRNLWPGGAGWRRQDDGAAPDGRRHASYLWQRKHSRIRQRQAGRVHSLARGLHAAAIQPVSRFERVGESLFLCRHFQRERRRASQAHRAVAGVCEPDALYRSARRAAFRRDAEKAGAGLHAHPSPRRAAAGRAASRRPAWTRSAAASFGTF